MYKLNTSDDRLKVAQRLKDARVASGLSQDHAAKKMGLQRPAISEIEAGNRKVSAEEIIQFAELYRVKKAWLLLEETDEELMQNEKYQFAARELSKLDKEDMEKVLAVLRMLKK